jgi:DNA-binding transcriptional MerR regulator
MTPELQKRIDQARKDGFSEEEISQVLAEPPPDAPSGMAQMPNGYQVPILSDQEKAELNRSQTTNESINQQQATDTALVGAGLGAGAVAGTGALLAGAKYLLKPAVTATSGLAQRGVAAAEEANQIARMNAERIAANQAAKAAATAPAAAPVRPSAILDQYGRPMAPPAAAPVAPQPLSQQVQQAAASRITNMPAAAPGMMARAGSVAGKLLPGAGTALNAYDAYNRYQQGDMVGAGISGAAAAASPFPVLGTAVGLGALAANQARDYFGLTPPRKKPQP